MEIPIYLKLKKRMHKDVAYAQDIIVEELYKVLPIQSFMEEQQFGDAIKATDFLKILMFIWI